MVIREFGGPAVMRWEEIPTPTPGPGEVLIRVHAVSVNRTLDLQVRLDGGGYATHLCIPASNCVPIPDAVPFPAARVERVAAATVSDMVTSHMDGELQAG